MTSLGGLSVHRMRDCVAWANPCPQCYKRKKPAQKAGDKKPAQMAGDKKPAQMAGNKKPAQMAGDKKPAQMAGKRVKL